MVATDARAAIAVTPSDETASELERVLVSTDHKVPGRLFIGFGLFSMMLTLVAWALAHIGGADDPLLGAWANGVGVSGAIGVWTMGVIPVTVGLGLYLVPLQIGARGASFPRGIQMAFWTWFISSVIFVVSVLNDGGIGGRSNEMTRMGMIALAMQILALMLALAIVMTTLFTQRTHGMNMRRVPLFSFSLMVTGFVWVVTLSAVSAEIVSAYAMRATAMTIRDTLVPRIAFLGWAPAAMAVAIPVLGIIGDVAITQSGKRLLNRDLFQDLIALFGVSTIGVWAIDPATSVNNLLWTLLIGLSFLSALAYLGGLAAHLRGSAVRPSSALALSGASAVLLLLALLSGALGALNNIGSSADGWMGLGSMNGLISGAQASFAIGAAITGLTAAIFHWGPKLFGSAPKQSIGSLLAPVLLVGGIAAGAGGVLLTIGAATDSDLFEVSGIITAIGLTILAVAAFMVALAISRSTGAGEDDPWGGQTLEWATSSPPPVDDFGAEPPKVTSAAPLLDSPQEGDN
jgi:heme/copper-type cytochrome/quinol oxidase subunit 1